MDKQDIQAWREYACAAIQGICSRDDLREAVKLGGDKDMVSYVTYRATQIADAMMVEQKKREIEE